MKWGSHLALLLHTFIVQYLMRVLFFKLTTAWTQLWNFEKQTKKECRTDIAELTSFMAKQKRKRKVVVFLFFVFWLLLLAESRLTHTLLPRSFCTLKHFTSKWLGTLCFPTRFDPQHTLLPDTLYSSAHFVSKTTFFLSTLCFQEHFAP